MDDLLKVIYEFRSLRARRDVLKNELSPVEDRRLVAFENMFVQPGFRLTADSLDELGDRRHFSRVPVDMPASVEIGPGLLERVRVCNISGGGVEVTPPTSLERGEITVIAMTDDDVDAPYQLPAQVMWQTDESQGLCFVGVPD